MTKQEAIEKFLKETSEGGSVGRMLNKSFPEYCRHRDHLAMQLGQLYDIDPREFLSAETDRMARELLKM